MSQAPKSVNVKGVTITTHADLLSKALDALTKRELLVGIPRDHTARTDANGVPEGPITNASIGYIMEFGSAAAHIPARPWLVPGMQNARTRIVVRLVAAAKAALAGKYEAVEMQYQALGFECVSAVQRKITTGPFVPLAPATLAARRARGFKGTKPLIDTGQLRRSVTFVIRPTK